MSVKADAITTDGMIWVGDAADPMDGPVVLEGEEVIVSVERTDTDEVAIHMTLSGDDNAVVSLYMSRIKVLALTKLLELEARS